MSLKNPVTPPGIDPGTVRLVAQRLNHYAPNLLIIADAITGQCFTGMKFGDALDFYSEGTWVESRPKYRLH